MGEGGGGRLFEAGRLLTFSAFKMGAYSRWALIRGWALIRINTVITNSVKRIINKQNVSAKSRMCGEGDETVSHIVSECRKLAQKQFISILEA